MPPIAKSPGQLAQHHRTDFILLLPVSITITSVEDAQIVYILYITLLKVKVQTVISCAEFESIECFCLGLGDRRYGGWPSEAPVSSENASNILDQKSLLRVEIENWSEVNSWFSTEAERDQSV